MTSVPRSVMDPQQAHWLRWLFVFLTVIISCSKSMAGGVVIGVPTLEVVSVFERPDASSQVIGQMSGEGALELIETLDRWFEVRIDSTTAGFVPRTQTRTVEDLPNRGIDELRVHFLNVGAGSCAIVECPGSDAPALVVDCGSIGETNRSLSKEQVVERVQKLIGDRLTHVVVSHADRDHYRYIPEALKDENVGHIWLGGEKENYSSDEFLEWVSRKLGSEEDQRLHHGFDSEHFSASPIAEGLSCGAANSYILTVNAEPSKNGKSLVLEIRYGNFAVTFTGDAIGDTEASAIRNFHGNVATTVLSASHHGADTHDSNSSDWAKATSPKVVIFSAGKRFGHPRCEAVKRFRNLVARVPLHATHCGEGNEHGPVKMTSDAIYTTEHSGAIIVTSNGGSPAALFCDRSARCQTLIMH